MAKSAWGRIVDDTIARVVAIVPTVAAKMRWHHVPSSRSSDERQLAGLSQRQFETNEIPGEVRHYFGAGLRQQEWVLILEASYVPSEDIQDVVASDHVDLINALQPTSTYSSLTGSWGALKRRRCDEPEEPVAEDGMVTVRFPISILFNQAVNMVP